MPDYLLIRGHGLR